jgi:hypothetical protein
MYFDREEILPKEECMKKLTALAGLLLVATFARSEERRVG